MGNPSYSYFDKDGQLTEALDANGNANFSYFDADGRVTETVDGAGDPSYSYFDPGGRLTESVDALNKANYSYYDGDGNVTQVVDPDSNVTTFAFDGDNRKVAMTDPLHATAAWLYDADGRLTKSTDRDGRTMTMAYDPGSRLIAESWFNSLGTLVNSQSWQYDHDGNITGAADNNGTYTMSYDPASRLINQQEPFGLSLTYSYDGNGNVTGVVDSTGGVTTSVYDADNQLISRQYTGQGASLRFDQTWTADNQLGTVTRYSGLTTATVVGTTSYTYDPGQRLIDVQHLAGTVVLDDFAYTYNGANWLITETDNGGTPTTYQYDVDGQLTGVVGTGAATYSYDSAGNRTNPGYSTGTGNQVTSDGTYTYTYDAEGNRLTRTNGTDVTTYTYDNNNHLTGFIETVGGVVQAQATYVYDVFGNRIEADDSTGGVTTITRFGYDGTNVWADLDGTNTLQTRYVRPDGTDALAARVTASSSAVAWYLTDRQGSVRALTDGSGVQQDQLTYDGYGKLLSETNTGFGDRYKYTGREWDGVSQLQYNRARYYDPSTGGWVSQDPKGFGAGDYNLYRYVHNGPTDATDPSGLDESATSREQELRNRIYKIVVVQGGQPVAPAEWPAFGLGVVKGFFEGLKGTVEGLATLGKWALKYNIITGPLVIQWRRLHGEDPFAEEKTAYEVAKQAARFALVVESKKQELIQAIVAGDTAKLKEFGGKIGEGLAAAKDIMIEAAIALDDLSPEDKGRIYGQILYVVAETALTAGAAEALESGKLATLAAKIEKLPGLVGPRVKKAIDVFVKLLEGGTEAKAGVAASRALEEERTAIAAVEAAAPKAGETASTATGKTVHKAIADARRASGEFDLVQSPITDKAGNPILVSKRVNLKTGLPQPGSPLQEAVPDAVSFQRKLILDDKPLGRPISKDRQEIIRFIKAYEQREGQLPDVIGITRYDPGTGQQVLTELYSPSDFLP